MRTMRGLASLTLVGVLSVTACNLLTVTNPGPIVDSALNTSNAATSLVNGMGGDLSYALGNYVDRGALASGELMESGTSTVEEHFYNGSISPEDANQDWADMQTARWTAENGIARLSNILGSTFSGDTDVARAYLYGGFSNRLLGENMCQAVIDDGPAESDTVFFQRAESLFTRAYTLATSQNNPVSAVAALGGRASVRAWQGNWSGAIADAAQVPDTFVYNAIFSSNSSRENLDLYNQTEIRRETTVYGTVYANVFNDPRTPWDSVRNADGTVEPGGNGSTPFFLQLKYDSLGAPVPLTKGAEMRLLRAEYALRSGDINGMTAQINAERAIYPGLAPVSAPSNTAAAWTLLQAERGAVTWLEGRWLWDLRRWFVEGTNTFLATRPNARCIPISLDERGSNPNLH